MSVIPLRIVFISGIPEPNGGRGGRGGEGRGGGGDGEVTKTKISSNMYMQVWYGWP